MTFQTGQTCPKCKKGKLYPTGGREVAEPDKKPGVGLLHDEKMEYECDQCGFKTEAREAKIGDRVTGNVTFEKEVL